MKVKVLFFAALREQVGVTTEEIDLPGEKSTIASLRAHLAARGDQWQSALSEKKLLRFAVNQDMAQPDALLKAGDEVAFFPPVTGG
jgi:molybdopterin synthase sulfur carrier subunit